MKKLFLVLPLLSIITACTPPMTRDQELAIYRSRCLDYGYQYGTREFADCMQMQEAREADLDMQRRKVQAIQDRNWIEQQKVWTKEKENKKKK